MEVERYTRDPEAWNRFVRDRTGWTHFHLYGWRQVLGDVFGHPCPYLGARDERGELKGVLPLVRVSSLLFGDYLVSMPFLNYGGPLGTGEAVESLAGAAATLAAEEDVDLLELRARRQLPLDLAVSHRKITVLLDLPADADVLWDDLDSKVRSQVRRPRKEGIEVRFGPGELDGFYRVFSRHMRDLGTPAQPRKLFEAAGAKFGDDMWFGCAYLDGEPIAGGSGFRWAREFEMTWASDLIEYRKMAPNMLLYWSFMERCIEEGVTLFNFGRCTPGSGTHRFKKQWGTRDEQLRWYQASPGGTESTPSPDDDAWRWGPKVWRRLPMPVARVLGPRIARWIP